MRTVAETWELLGAEIPALEPEAVELSRALGHTLRMDVLADTDQPPFARSAMDGYLVRLREAEGVLRVTGEITPGAGERMPGPGTAIRVFTGSAVPEEGAAVVIQEEVDRDGEFIRLRAAPRSGYIRPRGSHARRGDLLVAKGTRLSAGPIALLAASGISRPMVSPAVRVSHLATGRELVDHGVEPGVGQIRDTNSPMIAALIRGSGAALVWQGRVDEDAAALMAALAPAIEAGPHILLISGGASVGDHDHTADVLRDAGFKILVHGVAVRPGKPLIVARRARLLAFCLPGNPLSHFTSFHLFVRRAISHLSGEEPARPLQLPVEDVSEMTGNPRETWWPCRLANASGKLLARPLAWRDSSDITSLAQVEGLLRVPPDGIRPADFAEVLETAF